MNSSHCFNCNLPESVHKRDEANFLYCPYQPTSFSPATAHIGALPKSEEAQLPPLDVEMLFRQIAENSPRDEHVQGDMNLGAELFWKLCEGFGSINKDDFRSILVRICRRYATTNRQLLAALSVGKAQDDKCDVCCGDPLPNGGKCICGGTGNGYDEKIGLRRECMRLEDELESVGKAGGESTWIDVNQELPPLGRLVIVVWGGIVQTCLYTCNIQDGVWSPFDEDFDCAPLGTFSHWMPLPAPPYVAPKLAADGEGE